MDSGLDIIKADCFLRRIYCRGIFIKLTAFCAVEIWDYFIFLACLVSKHQGGDGQNRVSKRNQMADVTMPVHLFYTVCVYIIYVYVSFFMAGKT